MECAGETLIRPVNLLNTTGYRSVQDRYIERDRVNPVYGTDIPLPVDAEARVEAGSIGQIAVDGAVCDLN